METLAQDLRYAVRSLRKSPGFALTAMLTLALGIGASTAIFSVVNGVLLRPLPYSEPARVMELVNRWEGTPEADLSPAELFDYQEQLTSFESVGGYTSQAVNLTGGDTPERLQAGFLTASVFPALGVAPAVGGVFGVDDDRPGAEAVVVLSHDLWVRRFGASPATVGSQIMLDGSTATVLGVMPPDFRLPADLRSGEVAEIFLPLRIDRSTIPNRGSHFLSGIGRLRGGVAPAAAAAEMEAVAAGFVRDFADDYAAEMQFGATALPVTQAVLGGVRPVLLVLLGAVGFVLLIACANVASLLLGRVDRRHRELAVRAAMGAGRLRLARQLGLESLALAAGGGALGLVLAVWATDALPLLQPPDLPRIGEVQVDPRVLGFAVLASLLCALLFGLAPALHASRADIQSVLKESGRSTTAGAKRQRLRGALVAGEVALAVVLLLGAGLLIRSLVALYGVDPGYRTERVLTMRLSLPAGDYGDAARVTGFYRQLTERLAGLPGVDGVGAVSNLPLASSLGDLNFQIQGREVAEGDVSPRADWQVVTPGYFGALGMQLLRGRGIEATDGEEAPGVIVVNESLADLYWPGRDPIGERLLLGGGAGPGWVTVVGVARDVRHAALSEAPRPEMYLSHRQFRIWGGGGPVRAMSLAVRASGDPLAVLSSIRGELRRMDPNLPIADVRTLEQVRAESVAQPRFLSVLLGGFSAVALLLATIGIYGTLAFLVTQRTHEIGVRMALGARATEVVRMVVRRGMLVTLAGVGIGLAAALLLTRLLAHLLFGVGATDLATFVAVPILLVAVALLASYLPARRATRVDPMIALRAE